MRMEKEEEEETIRQGIKWPLH